MLSLSDRLRKLREGLEEGIVISLLRDLPRNLRRHPLHDDLRLQDARSDPFTHERDGLIHVSRKAAQSANPIFVVLHRFKAQRVCEIIGELDAVTHGDRHEMKAKADAFQR